MSAFSSTIYSQATKGGALTVSDPTYAERGADHELYEFLITEERETRIPCVLAPRQSGKSSLMVRIADKLKQKSFVCVQINIQSLGVSENDESTFYLTILKEIVSGVVKQKDLNQSVLTELEGELYDFWSKASQLSAAIRFQDFLTKLLDKFSSLKLVVFLDEVQSLISWKIQDNVLGCLRAIIRDERFLGCKFVLLGVAKPNDLIAGAEVAFNSSINFELSEFTSDCPSLISGLEDVFGSQSKDIFEQILNWTGGQPFLTQHICHLCVLQKSSSENYSTDDYVDEIVKKNILSDWRSQDPLGHFHDIENWFKKGYTSIGERCESLKDYQRIINTQKWLDFVGGKESYINLLTSGLTCKKNRYLLPKNRIYTKVFDLEWTHSTLQYLIQTQGEYMPTPEFFNRDVYFFIDRSGTMRKRDPEKSKEKSRWELLPEILGGHMDELFRAKHSDGSKVCERIKMYLFSHHKDFDSVEITDPDTVFDRLEDIFKYEYQPQGGTNLVPAFKNAVDEWKSAGRRIGRKAFFNIYSDGQLDDESSFRSLVEELARDIDDEKDAKINMIGIGADVLKNPIPFLDLDFGLSEITGKSILTFDHLDEIGDVVSFMDRQIANPNAEPPQWVQEDFSEWYREYKNRTKKK